MDATGLLQLTAALVVAAGLYRLARWRWRPRLVLGELLVGSRTGASCAVPAPSGPTHAQPSGSHASLTVRVTNRGARTARGCRARLVVVERQERGSWRRLPDSDRLPAPQWSDGEETAEIRPGGSRTLVVLEGSRLPPARYRITLAVMNGEERVRVYEVALPPDASQCSGADPGSAMTEES